MDKDKAYQLLDEAFDCIETGNYSLAKEKLEDALQIANDIPEIHSEYALVLIFLEDINKAKIHIDKSIELAPNNPKFWSALSNWYFINNDYENAITSITTAEILDPNYPAVYVAKKEIGKKLGYSKKETNKYHLKANELYKRYDKKSDGELLKPGDLDALLGNEDHGIFNWLKKHLSKKGTKYSNKNVQFKNETYSKKKNISPHILKELVPINSRTKFWKGINSPGSHPSEILRDVENYLKSNHHDPEALHQRAACLIALKDFKNGEKTCEKILNHGGDNPIDVCNYAICLANNGWIEKAIEMIDTAKNSLSFTKVEFRIGGQVYFNSALLHYLFGKETIGKDDYEKSKELGYHDNFNPFV